jgi:protein TonB
VYPAEAARDGITRGRVVAQLQVGEQGRVEHVEILEAQPPRVFDREVRRALAQWRYAPPGAPRQVAVELVFRLER